MFVIIIPRTGSSKRNQKWSGSDFVAKTVKLVKCDYRRARM